MVSHATSAPRWLVLVNGEASRSLALDAAVEALRAQGVAVALEVSHSPEEAARLVARAVDMRVDTVVAGGGDGTLSQVAALLARTPAGAATLPAIGVLPLGTANDFARAAGIPDDPAEALALVLSQPPQAVDLLRVEAGGEEHWCANLASGGFGTRVTLETGDRLKQVLGGLAYVVTGLAKLGHIEPVTARVRGPDFAWEGDFIALALGNGRQAGGGQALCPEACIDDGLLDVTVIPELEGELAATLGTALTQGREAALERIATRARLPWVEIEAPSPMTLNLDGEPVVARRFRVECVAARLRMHLPPGCPLLSLPGNVLPVARPAAGEGPAPGGGMSPLPA